MEIDLSFISQIDPQIIRISLMTLGGIFIFFFVVIIFRIAVNWFWLPSRQAKFLASIPYTLLAIDVPKENLQSPKAVESVFTTISGAYSGKNLKEKYIQGQVQIPFSLEIVSLDGYIQFLIRTPIMFRDLVESAIFAQYPDAEITEVMDYVNTIPEKFPDDTYDLWGTELTLFKPDAYPIRTHQYFEHSMSQEFKDPMAAILEALSRFSTGEQGWLQFVITPTDSSWVDKGNKEVKKIIGEKIEHKKTIVEKLTDPLLNFFSWTADTLIIKGEEGDTVQRSEPINRIQNLTPGEQLMLTAMQTKLSKIAFSTVCRYIYVAPKTIFSKAKGVASVLGAMGQYNSFDLNSLVPSKGTKTSADYVFVNYRMAKKQNAILQNYRNRTGVDSAKPFIFNIEELATVFHFPDMAVKAPLVKKTEAKRSEPPVALPTEIFVETEEFEERFSPATETAPTASPRTELANELEVDLANSYFENKFATAPTRTRSQSNQVSTPETTPTRTQSTEVPKPVQSAKKNPSGDGTPPGNLPL